MQTIFLLVLHSIELPEIQAGQFVNVRVDHSPSTFFTPADIRA